MLDLPDAFDCTLGTCAVTKLVWVRDLVYYDGPLVSLFSSSEDNSELWLFYWVDVDYDALLNRWVVTRSDSQILKDLEADRIPFRDALLDDTWSFDFYVVDITGEQEYARVQLIAKKNLPEDYLPEPQVLLYSTEND
jgi:hypothetical protein